MAVKTGNSVELPTAKGADGDQVTAANFTYNGDGAVNYREFQKIEFSVSNHHLMVTLGDSQYPLMLNDMYINLSTSRLDNAVIK
jgi:hypothetical protein